LYSLGLADDGVLWGMLVCVSWLAKYFVIAVADQLRTWPAICTPNQIETPSLTPGALSSLPGKRERDRFASVGIPEQHLHLPY
jgi:hypothetical protein